ncbi:hypothetical protein PInf_002605 [Phytophthora infestans]|nr:hypothetical protein PInf_002605 [Phytophthora infestans]
MGQSEWPDNYVTSVNATENEKERSRILGGGVGERVECADADEGTSEGSFGLVSSAARDEPKGHSKMMKLSPGERQGWWSAKKFDRRIRMRALVQGAVNDQRTRILLDTGANASVITDAFAKKLQLRDVPDRGRRIDIQGINEGKVSTTRRACVKITLGWEMVYEFEMWVMAHSAGVDVVLGTDFIIPAGIRLDLFHGAAQLPHEVQIPLIKTKNMIDSEEYGSHVNAGPPERLDIQAHEWREYRLAKRQVGLEEHVLWVRRTNKLIPSVTRFRRGRPQSIRLTNVSDRTVYLPAHDSIAMWIPDGDLPRGDGYVRLESKKYQDWQPSAVDRPNYLKPSGVLARPLEDSLLDSSDRLTCAERWALILEERERVEACLASGVTAGDSADGQPSAEPLDTYTTTHGGGNNANEASVVRTHELLRPVNVVHTPTSVSVQSGVTTEATRNGTGLNGVTRFDEAVPALCVTKSANEPPVVDPEDTGIAQKVLSTAPSIHCKIGANSEMSRQRQNEERNKSQQPNIWPRDGNQDGKEMDQVPAVEIKADANVESREESVAALDGTYISVARVLTTEGNEATEDTRNDFYEHPANNIGLDDYAKELAFLPDLTEEINTTIDYTAPNVADPELSTERRERLVATLKNHEHILIASGNALPPPAYGAVCDIDTQGHAPIKQRARRVPLRFLGKLYELLRALLRAGLIVFIDSPWASPIVIVMKKNGLDIRLCIDYKMVNAITAILEYAMPLVDDLLTDLERYL